jgi:hypothetical protein
MPVGADLRVGQIIGNAVPNTTSCGKISALQAALKAADHRLLSMLASPND